MVLIGARPSSGLSSMTLAPNGAADDDGYHFAFTIPSNTQANTPIGAFGTAGQIAADSQEGC